MSRCWWRAARATGFALVKGIIPDEERTVSNLLDDATPGSVQALEPDLSQRRLLQRSAALVLGKRPRRDNRRQRRRLGDAHQPAGRADAAGHVPKYVPFRLRHFHSGFYQYDSGWAFMRLADAQRLFDEPDLLSVISFKVDNLNRAPRLASEIEQAAGKGFMTTNWIEQNRELFRALKLEQVVTFIVIALIVIVAALNILIALTMMVMEKTRDIAVMMSFGVEPGQVRRIFLMQGC